MKNCMKQRAFTLLLAVTMLLVCLPLGSLPVMAEFTEGEVIASGTTGDCSWKATRLYERGESGAPSPDGCVLTISGNGAMADYDDSNNVPWNQNAIREPILKLVIQNGVTKIGANAFAGLSGIQSVTLPNSVTAIGERAFSACSSLAVAALPNSVKVIGDVAFSHTALTSVTIPSGVTEIGDSAFWGCASLTTVNYNAVNASCGDMSESYHRPFYESGVKTVTIGNGVKTVPVSLFYDCTALTKVTIPNSVTIIEDGAFCGCSSLTAVTIPDSVTKIGNSAFEGSGLTAITIPKNITQLGWSAFQDCSSLKSVAYDAIDCKFLPTAAGYYVPPFGESAVTTVTVGNGVQQIPTHLFHGCDSLATVTIPESVTDIGPYAFMFCDKLKDVYYGGSKTQWKEIYFPYDNEPLEKATIHYGKEDPSTTATTGKKPTATQPTTGKKPPVAGTITAGKTTRTVHVPVGGSTTTGENVTTTTTTAPEKLVVLVQTDSATVEAASDAFPADTQVKLEALAADALSAPVKTALQELAQKFVAFEITATANGAAVQPGGTVKATFTIPSEYDLDKVAVLYVSPDGQTEVVSSTVDRASGKIIAELSHFSTYVVAELDEAAASTTTTTKTTAITNTDSNTEAPDDDKTPGSFPWAIVVVVAVVLIAGGVTALLLIKNKKQ